jgi:glycosyltransferase involved in cell wall biosynthesis
MVNQVHLSLITHGYNCQSILLPHSTSWGEWQKYSGWELVFVDDGSPQPLNLHAPYANIRQYRIVDDIPWNQPGARNLGACQARGEWLLFFDLDHRFATGDFLKVLALLRTLSVGTLYKFARSSEGSGLPIHSHMNSFLISRSDYFKNGGYDEDFSGSYGYEDVWFQDVWLSSGRTITTLCDIKLSMSSSVSETGLGKNWAKNKLLRRRKKRTLWLERSIFKAIIKGSIITALLAKFGLVEISRNKRKLRFFWVPHQDLK